MRKTIQPSQIEQLNRRKTMDFTMQDEKKNEKNEGSTSTNVQLQPTTISSIEEATNNGRTKEISQNEVTKIDDYKTINDTGEINKNKTLPQITSNLENNVTNMQQETTSNIVQGLTQVEPPHVIEEKVQESLDIKQEAITNIAKKIDNEVVPVKIQGKFEGTKKNNVEEIKEIKPNVADDKSETSQNIIKESSITSIIDSNPFEQDVILKPLELELVASKPLELEPVALGPLEQEPIALTISQSHLLQNETSEIIEKNTGRQEDSTNLNVIFNEGPINENITYLQEKPLVSQPILQEAVILKSNLQEPIISKLHEQEPIASKPSEYKPITLEPPKQDPIALEQVPNSLEPFEQDSIASKLTQEEPPIKEPSKLEFLAPNLLEVELIESKPFDQEPYNAKSIVQDDVIQKQEPTGILNIAILIHKCNSI
jgi:hypothetical protein